MITKIHAAAGVIGFLCILTFWTATVASELFGSDKSRATACERVSDDTGWALDDQSLHQADWLRSWMADAAWL